MGLQDRIAELRQQLEHPEPTKWYKRWWGILFLTCLFLFVSSIGAGGIYIFKMVKDINAQKTSINTAEKVKADKLLIEGSDNYWLGTSSPQITIVEFSDFSCPYCKDEFPIIRELGIKYKDQVKIIYRDYLGHDNSLDLALAARCAGEQGKFWNMHDKLFVNQDQITLTGLPIIAQQLGLDVKSFNSCISSKKYIPQIRKDVEDADTIGITKTPSFMINGYKLEGAINRTDFINIIETILQK